MNRSPSHWRLVDAPGGTAAAVTSGQARSQGIVREHRAEQGDRVSSSTRVREVESNDAFEHTHAVLNMVSQRMQERGHLLPDGRLPHHVAVCVTKFDELRMMKTAGGSICSIATNAVSRGCQTATHASSSVRLCRQFRSLDSELIFTKLERAFHPDRIKYYVTSAIGFYVDPHTDRCDPEDFQNHLPAQAGRPPQIRGDVIPVNVAEPILWLAQA